MMIRRWILGALAALGVTSGAVTAPADAQDTTEIDPENLLLIDLPHGRVVIEMFPDVAPNHVARIKTLARQGFYDGLIFHRVIPGFMAQGGDPQGTGAGGSDLPDLQAEFNDKRHLRGTASMARAGDPHSANSQFFIMFQPNPSLDGKYTVWGRVLDGMRAVDKIAVGEPPAEPTPMVRVRVAADVTDDAPDAQDPGP
ncbi:peptidyl-prolyl cis-trans isomerase B (cyclophilin B) [Rhodothalassium salexigens DSM 2132]|uniref:Peptidyl-prolyl cis-trans isomerase n=2 Tax=Rhodothalassium salexigens TaxID=1086 RepID=A0A4R2PPP8_RHOSA|nr:peptidylprolyl isomerase [Rhodothalassium salexigens]MBB4210685.1 cyclophilin family peptidyl-prolyl cis-trans isomerase [Rhodothalassium salexigens DSM 2132]TCP37759.1 peptidyl-prolyl cis-trans isomerase B (cyclophilin B) [Rhodothalassium salexigens DSM 2132]